MEFFAKVANDSKPLIIFAKCPILNLWQGSEYAFATEGYPIVFILKNIDSMLNIDVEYFMKILSICKMNCFNSFITEADII